MQKIIYLTLALFALANFGLAQSISNPDPLHSCGTETTDENVMEELRMYPDGYENLDLIGDISSEKSNFLRVLDVKIIVIRRDDGAGNVTTSTIDNYIQMFNQEIEGQSGGNTFKVRIRRCGSIKRINNTRFWKLGPNERTPLKNFFFKPKMINIYFVEEARSPNSGVPVCGYATIPGSQTNGENFIVVDRGCGFGTFAHELGHALGLYHTHETRFGVENVARSGSNKNCNTAGDRFCLTPADPVLLGRVNSSCSYAPGSNPPLDPQGVQYQPATNNYMSFTPQPCRTKFVNGQELKAYAVATQYKQQGNRCPGSSSGSSMVEGKDGVEAEPEYAFDPMRSENDFLFQVYPNPTTGKLNLMADFAGFDHQEDLQLTITNVTGQIQYSQQMDRMDAFMEIPLPTEDLSDGVYMLTITNKYMRKAIRFVKQ